MSKQNGRPITPGYIIFYILFSTDTWRILVGVVASVLLTPRIQPPDLAMSGRIVLHVMVAGIGWAISAKPAGWITSALKKALLGKT